jgi:hypothetical protein
LKGEWIRDHVGLVAHVEGRGFYAYPFQPALPRGPYETTEEAMEALDSLLPPPRAHGPAELMRR